MMVTVSEKFLEGGEKNLPPLSPNLEASQLLTPLQLERITIDNPHYREHLMQSMIHQTLVSPVPNHQHVLHRRTAKLGDNYFFLQKDIPVRQNYARTALKLSEVRPWDQIVDRPMYTHRVIGKEVHLPFPQQHPYTSHISRFAVFPDTKHHQPHPDHDSTVPPCCYEGDRDRPGTSSPQDEQLQPKKASVQTQTTLTSLTTSLKPLPAYYIHQKASEWGQRVEEHHLRVPGISSLNTDVGRTFWDLPRSRQHKRANTYPAPRLLYSTQLPDTPTTSPQTHSYLTTPQKTLAPPLSQSTATPPITPRTNDALNTIHTLLTRTTTYSEQFPRHTPPANGNQNILRLDYSLRSCGSQRPWTNESRGKYCRRIPLSPRVDPVSENNDDASEADDDVLGISDGVVFSLLKGAENTRRKEEETRGQGEETHKSGVESHCTMNNTGYGKAENCDDQQTSELLVPPDKEGAVMVDMSTQTVEEEFHLSPNGTIPLSTTAPQLQVQVSTLTHPQAQRLNRLPQVTGSPRQPAASNSNSSREMTNNLHPSLRLMDVSRRSQSPKLDVTQLVKFPLAKHPVSASINSLPVYNALQNPNHIRSYSADASLYSSTATQVRTGEVTRRLMGPYNGFNRTEILRKFHEQYPEKAPDLREYNIRDGKRHIIHGSHAYYFH